MYMIYLASPYSHDIAAVRKRRAVAACMATGKLTDDGECVFSPIATSHTLLQVCSRPWNDPWWYEWSMGFLRHAGQVWVLMLDGWKESRGVQAEIEEAKRLGIFIRYVAPETVEMLDEP